LEQAKADSKASSIKEHLWKALGTAVFMGTRFAAANGMDVLETTGSIRTIINGA